MGTKITMQHLADRLGISKFSISQALSGKPGISEETRQSVLETARIMGYKLRVEPARHNTANNSMIASEPKAGFVLVWMDPMMQSETEFWGRVLSGISAACREFGWSHLIVPLPLNDEMPAIPQYIDQDACLGMISIGTCSTQTVLEMKRSGLPLVLIDHEESFAGVDCVVNANMEAAGQLCRFVISGGSKSLIFVGNPSYTISFKERWWGCKLTAEQFAAKDRQIRLKHWIVPMVQSSLSAFLENRLAAMQESEFPDAFICANDSLATDILSQLRKHKIDVPGRCKVAGIDNLDSSAHIDPPLTTVNLGKEALGYRAVEALQRRIKRPGIVSEKIVLSCQLVIRESC